jgi:DNA polymerase epsilon subunit 2
MCFRDCYQTLLYILDIITITCEYFYVFCIRYAILHQLTRRHKLFTPAIFGTNSDDAGYKYKLQPIEFLLGSSGKVSEAIVLGLLTQLREGRYYLEDPTGILQLDLSKAISFTMHYM